MLVKPARFSTFLEVLPGRMVVLMAAGLLVALAIVDVATGPELSFSIFYVLPISMITWRLGRHAGVAASSGGALAWYLADRLSGAHYSHPLIPLWNSVVRLGFFLMISGLLASLARAHRQEVSSARTDPLTGLPNRRRFEELALHELARAARSGSPVTVAILDLDGFKAVNDRSGHAAGDEVLRHVAIAAATALREVDVKARLGGDEFGFVLPDTGASEARRALFRLADHIGRAAAGTTGLGSSIGAVSFEGSPLTLEEALERADAALYRAKLAGKGRVEIAVVPAPVPVWQAAG